MALHLGTAPLVDLRLGASPVSKLMLGDVQVWPGDSPPVWTPLDDPGVQDWFDPTDDASFTIVDGRISEWRSRTGGRVLLQALANMHPARFEQWVHFRAADRLDAATLQINEFGNLCYRMISPQSGRFNSVAGGPPHATLMNQNLEDASTYRLLHAPDGAPVVDEWRENGVMARNTPHWNGDPGAAVVRPPSDSTMPWLLGWRQAGAPYTFFRLGANRETDCEGICLFGHIVLCGPGQSDALRQKIEGFIAHDAGIADRLPADHPYKTAPPLR